MNNLLICKGISKNSCSFLAFLLFTFILIVPAAAQTLKEHDITLRVQNEPVESVFNKISKQTNFKFLYDQETVNKAPRVSFDIKNASLKQILAEITTQAKLYFNLNSATLL
jgi:type II secretory pathway component GspD/PulD (secretin)